jgi:isocitrate dehydrogenase
MEKTRITIARGDGIGPEIMDAVLKILLNAGARIEIDEIEVGEQVYLSGNTSGIPEKAWETIKKNKVLLKAPITTPQGSGYKSINVTIRKTLGLYANLRPIRSFHPIIPSKSPYMNLIIVRENEEDVYGAIEYQQTSEMTMALKLISVPGTEKVVRFAFEYAKAVGRKKVTCMTKDNILKISDGLFHRIFEEVGKDYPEIEKGHWIIDIGMAKLANSPEIFDVVVLPNLYGDIASDVVAEIAGSVGLAGSANIGDEYAMFEAVHGSAPKYKGLNKANPSGLLNAAIMMLVHIGQGDIAQKIENAWLKTLEDRVLTYDLVKVLKEYGITEYKEVGTKEFADAVVERLGEKPTILKPAQYPPVKIRITQKINVRETKLSLRGVDVFLDERILKPHEIGKLLEDAQTDKLKLIMITNRGQKVYPSEIAETLLTDHWRCRFESQAEITHQDIRELLERIGKKGLHWIKLENLYFIGDKRAYSLGQGQ